MGIKIWHGGRYLRHFLKLIPGAPLLALFQSAAINTGTMDVFLKDKKARSYVSQANPVSQLRSWPLEKYEGLGQEASLRLLRDLFNDQSAVMKESIRVAETDPATEV